MKSKSEMKRIATVSPNYMADKYFELQQRCAKLQASNKAIKQLADEMAGALNNIRSCTNDLNPQRKIFFKANEVLTKYNAFKERDNG